MLERVSLRTDERVVVHEVVQISRSVRKARHELARVQHLLSVGDDSLLDERDDAIGKRLRVNSQVAVIVKLAKDGVGNRTNTLSHHTTTYICNNWHRSHKKCPLLTHLQSSAVFDEVVGDELSNATLLISGFGAVREREVVVALHHLVEVRHVHVAVAERSRHVRVHLTCDVTSNKQLHTQSCLYLRT